MFSKQPNLFNKWDPANRDHDPVVQEIILYCASRLRAIVLAATKVPEDNIWLTEGLLIELVSQPVPRSRDSDVDCLRLLRQEFALAYIGMAAAVGHTIDIPIMLRALASFVFRGMPGPTTVSFDLEFLLALDAGDDEHDLAAVAASYHNEWWSGPSEPADSLYLSWENLLPSLEHHRGVTGIKAIFPRTLIKTAYTWSRHLADSGPPGKEMHCIKCRMYRGVSLGVLQNLQDLRHHVHALEVTQEARTDSSLRRTAGLFQIHQAITMKELQNGGSKGKGKAKQVTSRTAEEVRLAAAADLVRLQNAPELKWTWGESLTPEEVFAVFNPSAQTGRVHSGYINSLPAGQDAADSSVADFNNTEPRYFSEIGSDVYFIPELPLHLYPSDFTRPPLRTYHDEPAASGIPAPPDSFHIVRPSNPADRKNRSGDASLRSTAAAAVSPHLGMKVTRSSSESSFDDADPADAFSDRDSGAPRVVPTTSAGSEPDSDDADPADAFSDRDRSSQPGRLPHVPLLLSSLIPSDFGVDTGPAAHMSAADNDSEYDPAAAFSPRGSIASLDPAPVEASSGSEDKFDLDPVAAFTPPMSPRRSIAFLDAAPAEASSESENESDFDPAAAFLPQVSSSRLLAPLDTAPAEVSSGSADESGFDPAAAFSPRVSSSAGPSYPLTESDEESEFDPATAFSPPGSVSSDPGPEGAFSDLEDDAEFDPAGAFSGPPSPLTGPFTPASFRPIREEELEPSDRE
jgi:hypothetical protein